MDCGCCPLRNTFDYHVALRGQAVRGAFPPDGGAFPVPTSVPCLQCGSHCSASRRPCPPAAGLTVPQEPRFPDIYGGNKQLWEEHFRGIRRAYRALGKEDDFAIRVLTEDFTLPFPFAWPPGPDSADGQLFYDPRDRAGFDFLLRGPGAQPPALLRPLHATAQAAARKRRLELLACSYARASAGQSGVVLLPPGAPAGFPGPRPVAPARESE